MERVTRIRWAGDYYKRLQLYCCACAACFFVSASFCPAPLSAGAGASGLQFMRTVQSPRAAAMGESGAALSGDLLSCAALNPASLSLSSYTELALVYNFWLEGIRMQQLAFAYPTAGKGTFGATLSMLSVSPFPGYDNAGAPAADVTAGNMAFGLLYARRVYGPWSDRRYGLFVGGGLTYASETLDTVKAGGLLYDAGALYFREFKGGRLGAGLSLKSLGAGPKFDIEQDKSPAVYRAAVSYERLLWGDPVRLAVDARKNSDGDGFLPSLGLELFIRRTLFLRTGYMSGTDAGSGLRFGVGFNLKALTLDYAIAKFGDFGYAHRFGISYPFGKPVEVTPHLTPGQERARWNVERAKVLMKNQQYYEAAIELDEALKTDPKVPEGMDLLIRVRNLIEKPR